MKYVKEGSIFSYTWQMPRELSLISPKIGDSQTAIYWKFNTDQIQTKRGESNYTNKFVSTWENDGSITSHAIWS